MPALGDLLPGAYAAALAALLAFVLHRAYDRLPVRALAVFAAVLASLFGPALFAGRTLLAVDNLRGAVPFTGLQPSDPRGNHLQGDQVLEIAPLAAEVRRTVRRGEWPLYSDRIGAGAPLLGNPLAQALDPLTVAAWPLPLPRAAGVTATLRVLVALLFGYLLLVRLLPARDGPAAARGGTRWAAVAGSLAYALGGYLLLWLGWPRASAAAWLPALLYAVLLSIDRGRRRDHLLLILVTLAILLGGDHNAALYSLLTAGAFALARWRRIEPARRATGALHLLAAGAIAFGLAAPVLLPGGAFVRATPAAAAVGGRGADALRQDPLGLTTLADAARRGEALRAGGERLVPAVAANAFGNSRYGGYRGPANSNEDAAVFAGSVVLLLALCGLGRRIRRPAGERSAGGIAHHGFFLGLAGAALLAVSHPPVIAQLLEHLPYLEPSPVYHQRAAFLFVLAAAALGAGELDRRLAAGGGRRSLAWAAGGLGLAITGLYAAFAPAAGWLSGRPAQWLAVQLGAIAVAVAVLSTAPRRWRGFGVTAALAAELLLLHGPANPALQQRLFYPQVAPLTHLQRLADEQPGSRIAALGPVAPSAVPSVPPVLPPGIAAVYGLTDVRATGRTSTLLYSELLAPLLPPVAGEPSRLAVADHPLLDLLGVRWLLTGPGETLPPASQEASPPQLLLDDPAGRVWQRPDPAPRLFLPAAAEVSAGAGWAGRVAALRDARRHSLVGAAPEGAESWQAGPPARADRLQIRRLTPARVDAAAELGQGRLLASSIFQDGGWRLVADGRRVPTVFANGPFAAAWLPAASREITWLYRPARFLTGSVLAALALAFALGWLGKPAEASR